MERILLQRGTSTIGGTPGEMFRNGSHLCFTMELEWKDNQTKVSSIPPGQYVAKKRTSQKYGVHWHIQDVPGRSMILIHSGNTIKDIEGCILVGNKRGTVIGKDGVLPAVLGSRDTMNMLRATLPDEFILEVRA